MENENLKILLCEDDENLGMLLREYLAAKGFNAELCPDGEAVAPWSALSTAARAEVVDFNGKTYNVRTLVGVNELYDVCRFRVDASKTQPAAMATATVPANSKVWLVNFADKKVKTEQSNPFGLELPLR